MCCHLVSLSKRCLASLLNTRLNGNKCYSEIPTLLCFQNKSGRNCNQRTNLSSSYNITNSLLSSAFAGWAQVTHHFQREHHSHTSVLLSFQLYMLNPCTRPRKPHKFVLFLQSLFFYFFLERLTKTGWLSGLREEINAHLPKTTGCWITMACPVWFSLLIKLQTYSLP